MNHSPYHKKILLIDGSALLYRSFYGIKPLFNSKGVQSQAILGFLNSLKKVLKKIDADKICVAWDSAKSVRKEILETYKSSRQETPSELKVQRDYVTKILDEIHIKQLLKEGFEADDILASIARSNLEDTNYIISPDKDLLQLVSPQTFVYDPFKEKLFTQEEVLNYFGFNHDRIKLYFSLLGDSSDDIPGVKGIGKVSATKLANMFSNLDNLYNNLSSIESEKLRTLLTDGKENAFLSEDLFELKNVDLTNESTVTSNIKNIAWNDAVDLYKELELKSFLPKEEKTTRLEISRQFTTVTSLDLLKKCLEKCTLKKEFALDLETSGLDWQNESIVGVSLAWGCLDSEACYIPLKHKDKDGELVKNQLSSSDVFNELAPVLQNESILKIFHNAKFDLHFLEKNGFKNISNVFDTAIAARLLLPEWIRVGLKSLSLSELGFEREDLTSILKDWDKSFANVPLEIATAYSALDASQTYELFTIFSKRLNQEPLTESYLSKIEFKLLGVLLKMETQGIKLCLEKLREQQTILGTKLNEVLNKFAEALKLVNLDPKLFNLNSPKQVHSLLFEHLQIKTQKKTTSVDSEVLTELAKEHFLPKIILEYRKINKLMTTYALGLENYYNPKTNAIHTNYSQLIVSTGRLSSSDPNLQNIPQESAIVNLRDSFVARPNYKLFSFDYSQIELRLLAHFSQDPVLQKAFFENKDIHNKTATTMFLKNESDVTTQERDAAKRINFSILYGLSAFSLAKEFEVSTKVAKNYIDSFFATYQSVEPWMNSVLTLAKENGFVETLLGRKRWFKSLNDRNKNIAQGEERAAINSVLQGSAADLIKLAMINVDSFLQNKNIGRILLQIHDEIICELNESVSTDVIFEIKEIMEKTLTLQTPISVNIKSGLSWGSLKKISVLL